MNPLLSRLDHLVYVTPDVAFTVDELGRSLGVAATPGGRHPAWGTMNALLSLGPMIYLEIMGPDPEARGLRQPRPFGIDSLKRPRLATWVSRGERLDEIVRTARRLGIDLGEVQSRSRQRPDGRVLTWVMTDLLMPREGGIIPYFIDWGKSPHPADGCAKGCTLLGLRAEHPHADRIMAVLRGLGLDLPITTSADISLVATLMTPRGRQELR